MNSRSVESRQTTIHQDLATLVRKHATTTYLRPIAEFSIAAFRCFQEMFAASGKKRLVIDSGCGTGDSTAFLAQMFPEAFVCGFDRSLHRTKKHSYQSATGNYAVLQAELEDMWRLLGVPDYADIIDFHALYYPNPYPKPRHILRRWHGHPLFAPMLNLAATTELRTNWRVYAEEFSESAQMLGYKTVFEELPYNIEPRTAFERKYLASGHLLYRVEITKNERH